MADTNSMTINLYYQYIMHDIDQWTFRLAKMHIDDIQKQAEAQSGGDSFDKTYYRRKIVESIAQLRAMLKNRLSVKSASGSDQLDLNVSGWQIHLLAPAFDCDVQTIADLMHKYIVRNVIVDWSMTYAPNATAIVSQELSAISDEISSEVYNRKKPESSDHTSTTTNIVNIT